MLPVHNEMASLPALWARLERLRTQALAMHRVYLVFVDDGSTDGSYAFLHQLALAQRDVLLVALSAAYGHQQALCAGLDCAPGDVVVTLDADLQDPPEYIEQMVALWQRGADVVYGVRLGRPGDSALKRLCAAGFYRLLNLVSVHAMPKDCGDFRLLDRRVVSAVQALPRHRPYVRGMVGSVGFDQVALPYMRAARYAGSTSYAWPKMLQLAWAGCVSFAQPSRVAALIAGMLGTACLALWLCGAAAGWLCAAWTAVVAIGCGLSVAGAKRAGLAKRTACYRIARVVGPRCDLAHRAQG